MERTPNFSFILAVCLAIYAFVVTLTFSGTLFADDRDERRQALLEPDPDTGLPYETENYLSKPPFKMPEGFPRTPDASTEGFVPSATEVVFYTKMTIPQIRKFYLEKMSKTGLTQVSPSSAVAHPEKMFILEYAGWPNHQHLEIMANQRFPDRAWVGARFIGEN